MEFENQRGEANRLAESLMAPIYRDRAETLDTEVFLNDVRDHVRRFRFGLALAGNRYPCEVLAGELPTPIDISSIESVWGSLDNGRAVTRRFRLWLRLVEPFKFEQPNIIFLPPSEAIDHFRQKL